LVEIINSNNVALKILWAFSIDAKVLKII
jgi:hypothetical protein